MARSKTAQPKHSLRKIAVVVATAVSGMSVYAQAAVEPKEDTITVTAAPAPQESAWGPAATIAARQSATGTKTDTPIQKVPQSISVVTAEEMALHQPKSVKEALSYTPGVAVGTRGASNTYDYLIIRGFAADGQSQNNYLNGLKMQGNFYNDAVIDPYMLERAEIMRGPVSVLYGKSSPGGLLNMVSKRPTTEPLKEVQFKAGTDSLFQTGFDFSDALDDDGVYSYRLTGLARSANAQQKGAEEQRYAIAPAFTWRPDDKTNFTFLSYFQNEPETGYYGWLPKEGTVEPLPNGKRLPTDFNEGAKNNTYSRNEKMIGYSFDHEFNDTFTVRQNLRFAQNKVSQKSVYGYGMCSDPLYSSNPSSSPCANVPQSQWGHTLTRQYVIDNEKLENFSVDTQLQSKFATGSVDHTLLTGVDFMRMRNDIDSWFGYAGSVAPSDIYNLDRSDFDFGAHPNPSGPYRVLLKQKQTGLYVQDQAQWDKVLVTLGGRYDWADQSSFNRDYGNKSDRDDKQFTWRGGVNYLFDNGVTPYFSYSESFEPASQTDANGDLFAPSKGKQYEVGVKYVPEDRPIVVTGALYQLTKTNNLMADPNGSLFSVEGGEIRARGVELEAKAALSASVNVVGSYTYTDAEYTTDTNYKGNTPAQVPKHMASLWADYTFFDGPLSGLTLGTGGRYTGSSYGDPANSFKVGSYTVVDALVRYDLARVGMAGSNVALHVNNLFDREYVASCFNTYGCFWGAERQVVATATFRF
ncbi:TPA: ferrichrome porin FhuA [Escherichia coli]|uniref:Ferrichrome-iron receptor FhuA n=4 Tax=Escherichia coli TaxID=562 RepID=A0AB38F2A8_ECOLX|nr:ferrichrome porin FhuA [Escherichia coli]EFW0008373.1 ferrichrome porin FhuA [Shigella sonnei]EHY1521604.1 ferrichrome porin FhuA [Escherichia coli O157]EKF2607034.1 ferrichrome porin FhuA [Escherichia coli O45]KAE9760062.1 ferrichrome porin FhuA [Enterobacteriaceae bacterium TzEc084]MVY22364.1 ferrichrome porin FhuA [Enterobacteriaceae bacterium 8376wB8]MVY91155.1 ferrichrome porin FhuA [Enterobacteriaceae bacterium 8376wD7]MVZ06716.1 ferrichrome porin FhuA [Enterobacteriaceae bacterium 